MTEPNLVYMADILLPTTIETNLYPWQYLVFTFLALGIFVYLWRSYRKPLNALTRQLNLGKQMPREIAHQLAQLLTKDCELSIKLDQLRFSRTNPNKESLLAIIYQLKKYNKLYPVGADLRVCPNPLNTQITLGKYSKISEYSKNSEHSKKGEHIGSPLRFKSDTKRP